MLLVRTDFDAFPDADIITAFLEVAVATAGTVILTVFGITTFLLVVEKKLVKLLK